MGIPQTDEVDGFGLISIVVEEVAGEQIERNQAPGTDVMGMRIPVMLSNRLGKLPNAAFGMIKVMEFVFHDLKNNFLCVFRVGLIGDEQGFFALVEPGSVKSSRGQSGPASCEEKQPTTL